MANIDNHIQFTMTILDILGSEEPVTIDTRAVAHNRSLSNSLSAEKLDKLKKDGIFTIGKKNIAITKKNIIAVMTKIQDYLANPIFEGRSYFFEGIRHRGSNNLFFRWGS